MNWLTLWFQEHSMTVFCLVLGCLIGRAFQQWADGQWECELEIYALGYQEGYKDSKYSLPELY